MLKQKEGNSNNNFRTFTTNVKVKFTLEQAMKAQKGSRGIVLPFL